VREDDVDAESRHAHDAGEAVDEAEEGLTREGRKGKEESGEAKLVSEEGKEAVSERASESFGRVEREEGRTRKSRRAWE
jgi:hypothetical protein